MPIHTHKIDYETKKLLREILAELKNMNHAQNNRPSGDRYRPPRIKKR